MTSSSTVLQFQNCYILRNHKIFKEDLWVRNKSIINPEPLFFEEKIVADIKIDCKGAIISPGFIDVQINGGFGVDFSHDTENIELGVEKVACGILAHGVTSFCPTLVTSSSNKYKQLLPFIKKKTGGKHGAAVLGVHLEGPFINKEKKGAHSVQYIRNLDGGLEDILETYGNLGDVSIITLAPELDTNGEIIRKLVDLGITVSLGHSMGNLSDGEKAMESGALFITHLFNAMLPFHHRDPGLVGLLTSQKIPPGKTMYYGIIADGIHTHPAALRIAYKSNKKGLVLVTDAISALGLIDGIHFIGELKVEIKSSRAFIAGTNTLCGSIANMNFCVQNFQKATNCSKVEALECATLHPAEVLGITDKKGTLNFGADADFILLDNDLTLRATFIAGDCVWEQDDPVTKCTYTQVGF